MAQRIRFDEPGAWLHVMNRGVARRTIFESRADHRYFLARAALSEARSADWPTLPGTAAWGAHQAD